MLGVRQLFFSAVLVTVKNVVLSGCVRLSSSPPDDELVPPKPGFSHRLPVSINVPYSPHPPSSKSSRHQGHALFSPAISVGYQSCRHDPTSPVTWPLQARTQRASLPLPLASSPQFILQTTARMVF